MAKMTVHIAFNKASVLGKIHSAENKGLNALSEQVIEDANQYCPEDQMGLIHSVYTHSDFEAKNGLFIIRWVGPHARYQWYGLAMEGRPPKVVTDRPLKYTKSKARKKWAVYAKTKHGGEWERVYQEALRKGLHDD